MYQIEYLELVVKKDIPSLPKIEKKKIKQAIEERLGKNPIHFGRPLRYSLKGCRRLRVGNYRVIFRLEKNTVLIIKIAHRKEVYQAI